MTEKSDAHGSVTPFGDDMADPALRDFGSHLCRNGNVERPYDAMFCSLCPSRREGGETQGVGA